MDCDDLFRFDDVISGCDVIGTFGSRLEADLGSTFLTKFRHCDFSLIVNTAVDAVARSVKRPELRSLKEVQLN